jgi:hypothetical protein
MNKKYFVLLEDLKEHRAHDSIADWLLDLERKKNEEDKKNYENIKEIEFLQSKILKNLPLEKLVWLAVIFLELKREEHKQNLDLSHEIRNALYEKWGNRIEEDKEETKKE